MWLSVHGSRSLSVSKYLPSYWLGLFLASASTGLSQSKSSWFMQYSIFLIDCVRPHMFPTRICWEAAEEESQRRQNFLLLTETLPNKYLCLRYHPSCWHCWLCGYSCHVLPPAWTVACATSHSAGVWTVCNIFSRQCLAKQHAHSCKGISVLECACARHAEKCKRFFLKGRNGCDIRCLLLFKNFCVSFLTPANV